MTSITGHRGARHLWPENSLTGFRNAVDLGCDAIEFDVHLTRAGELVVIHDPTLDRTTHGSGDVVDLQPSERAEIRLKDSDETIPTLDDVLGVLAPSGVNLHVEIKLDFYGRAYPDIARLVGQRLQAHGVETHSHLTCFDTAVLRNCLQHWPEIPRLVSADRSWVERRGGLDAFFGEVGELVDIVAIRHDYLDEVYDQVCALWPKNRLCAWTVNERDDILHWLDRGIGHITTDRPDLALK